MRPVRRILIAPIFLVILVPSIVRACSCVVTGSACSRGWDSNTGVVFLGKVTETAQAPPNSTNFVSPSAGYAPRLSVAVHFSIEESFYGSAESRGETVVYTGSGGGDCGYPFVVGTSYLVYAGVGSDGQLSTGICSGTQPEIMVGGLLKQLRAIHNTGHGFDLVGTLSVLPKGAGVADQLESQPLNGVPIRVIGNHGHSFSTVTDQHGAYSFDWLPPDTYNLEESLPPGFALAQGTAPPPFLISPADKQVSSFGCLVNIFVRADCQISGIVVDSTGTRQPGFVTLVPVDPKEALAARQRGGLPGDETEDGKFLLPQLPPGRYRLIFSPKVGGHVNLQRKFYWPPGNPANLGAIEIGLGQHIDDVRFEIPVNGSEK